MSDVYAVVTDRIIHLLEQGTIPWQKPWAGNDQLPRNFVSGRHYRGLNVFLLHSLGYQSPCWLTYKQATELGGIVRKGEKACPVVFWKWLDVEDEQTRKTKRVPFLRYFSAFNVAQCDGLNIPTPTDPDRLHDPNAQAETILDGMPRRPDIRLGSDRAFYSPSGDFVGMPSKGAFRSSEDFYSVLFHELTHATGHESRLNRKGMTGSDGEWSAFGSESYSKEELVAEMGAAFLCGHAGIVDRTVDNSAAYLAGWLSRLKSDRKLVVQAAAAAQRAADFILGTNHTGESGGAQ